MIFPLLSEELKDELDLRMTKVRQAMARQETDALLIASTVNIYYLTGGVCRGYFYLPIEGDPLFFIQAPAQPTESKMFSVRKPEQIPAILESEGHRSPRRLGLEYEDLFYSDVERLKRVFGDVTYTDATKIMREARLTKTTFELRKMREDGLKQSAVYSRVASCYQEGMTDLELQIEIERVLRKEGCIGFPRVAGARMEINMGSLIAGPNADAPSPYDFAMGGAGVDPSLPVGASGMIIKPGMSIMVDMNGGFNGYQTDMTRCWAVGDIEERGRRAHECSRAILRDLETFARPGVEIGEMYRRAVRIAEEAGLSDYFMGHLHKVSFIGHGVGIQLNEAPVIMERNKSMLEENMTLAIEPKFVLPGIGALGVENTYVVQESGLENLTPLGEELTML